MTAFPKPIKRRRVRKPLRRRSAKMEEQMLIYLIRRLTFLVNNRECLPCKKRGLRPAVATDVHHLHGRVSALLLYEPFWIPTCRKCHNWIGENIPEARRLGLLCEEGEWGRQPPATIGLVK